MRQTGKQYGFIVSLFIHAMILAIPISVVVKDKTQEMELFISMEETRNEPQTITEQREIKEQIKRFNNEKHQPENTDNIFRPFEEPPARHEHEVVERVPEDKKPLDESPKEDMQPPPKIENIQKQLEAPPLIGDNHVTIEQLTPDEKPKSRTVQQSKINTHLDGVSKTSLQSHSIEESERLLDTEFGSIYAPSFLHMETPKYPALARRLGKEGKVVLRLTIDEAGKLLNVEVVEGAGYGFTDAAIRAVKRSTFLPAKKNGKPIASRAILPIKFVLRGE
ncbi:MAG TPA: energy transducer TonB [Desulfurella acetivorans]|uniref:Energy transducer TonB n=1 Tax=Desulfurella acetivorans TaxID=33002 RepID=A0A7C6EB23_DESAE|nr:energy transducer TonB [Desulfurella acetivorans]